MNPRGKWKVGGAKKRGSSEKHGSFFFLLLAFVCENGWLKDLIAPKALEP